VIAWHLPRSRMPRLTAPRSPCLFRGCAPFPLPFPGGALEGHSLLCRHGWLQYILGPAYPGHGAVVHNVRGTSFTLARACLAALPLAAAAVDLFRECGELPQILQIREPSTIRPHSQYQLTSMNTGQLPSFCSLSSEHEYSFTSE
jgi:hypothetical protein